MQSIKPDALSIGGAFAFHLPFPPDKDNTYPSDVAGYKASAVSGCWFTVGWFAS